MLRKITELETVLGQQDLSKGDKADENAIADALYYEGIDRDLSGMISHLKGLIETYLSTERGGEARTKARADVVGYKKTLKEQLNVQG